MAIYCLLAIASFIDAERAFLYVSNIKLADTILVPVLDKHIIFIGDIFHWGDVFDFL